MPANSEIDILQPPLSNDGISKFLGLLVILASRKKFILGIPFIAAVIAAGISLSLPSIYTATTKLLPPQINQGGAAQGVLLGQLSAITAGGSGGLGIKNPNEIYISMLRSRDVLDEIIKRFDLQKVYQKSTMTDVRHRLEMKTKIKSGKDNVIAIEVSDADRARAAAIANAYTDALEHLTFRFAVTEASRRRLFMESQLQKSKQDLVQAEMDLNKFQEAHGLIEPQSQTAATISASAQLRAQITAKEVQLSAMRNYATAGNPDLIRLQQELIGLRAQQGKIENDKDVAPGDVIVPLGKAPTASLEYIRKMREVKYQETLFQMFAKLYESAKVDESRNPTLIQVLEKAIEPERRSKPVRSMIVLTTGLIVFLITVSWVLVWEGMKRIPMSESAYQRWQSLKRQLWLR